MAAKVPESVKPTPEAKVDEPAPTKAPAAGKGKKLPAALAKLQQQQEELKRREEEKARALAEEKARIEEEERREAEEEKRKEEAKALKKQDGTYLTKAQREEKLRNEMKLKQMIAAGVKIGGPEGGEKKKAVYDKRKKGGRKNPEEAKVWLPLSTHTRLLLTSRS